MSFDSLRTVSLAISFGALGVPGTLAVPGATSTVPITVIWLSPVVLEAPTASDFQRREMRRVLAVSRAEAPSLPRGSLIVAPERIDLAPATWRVDALDLLDVDHVRVTVVPEATA